MLADLTADKLAGIVRSAMESERSDKKVPKEGDGKLLKRRSSHLKENGRVDVSVLGPRLCGREDYANKGIDMGRLENNREHFGSNEVKLPDPPSYYSLLCEGLADPTLQILLFSAIVSLVLSFSQAGTSSHDKSSSSGEGGGSSEGIEGLSILLTVVVVINVQAMTNYSKAQEFRKQQIELESKKSAVCIRNDGELVSVHPKQLVVGDVIRIKVGTVIPADGVMLSGTVSMDESALTGESVLVTKEAGSVCVSGTNVIRGEGIVLILACGPHSVSGKIFSAIVEAHESTEENDSVLFQKLDDLAGKVGQIGMVCSAFIFFALLFHWMFFCNDKENPNCDANMEFGAKISVVLQFFITGVTVLVVAVPEGLPLAVTLSLAVALGRLLEDRNQVKRFESCETMGSATTICSDKTGTLTENKMMLVSRSEIHQSNMHWFHKCCSLVVSPESKVTRNDNTGEFKYQGNPTECAILRYCKEELRISPEKIQEEFHDPDSNGLKWGSHVIPFSSEKKFMAVSIKTPEDLVMDDASLDQSDRKLDDSGSVLSLGGHGDANYTLLLKGAPRMLLDKSTKYFDENGHIAVLDDEMRNKFLQQIEQEEDSARRCLGFAMKFNLRKKVTATQRYVFFGWVSIRDGLRPGIRDSVEKCRKAGVVIRMITGDSLPTAIAVAKECSILSSTVASKAARGTLAMTGAEFDERVHKKDHTAPEIHRRHFNFDMKEDAFGPAPPFLRTGDGKKVLDMEEFDKIWPTLRVMARCEPDDKLTLVKGIKASELYLTDPRIQPQVVAVTGDGTNDAPSLKSADIGFAMGMAGTEVAQQAADVILLDDSFNSIVRALVWGRNVHDSVCKFLQFQMTVNVSAVVLTSVGSLVLMKSPMNATQMLWVNMIMDSLGSLALATLNPNEDTLLNRKPINRYAPVITRPLTANIFLQSILQLAILLTYVLTTPKEGHDARFYTMIFNAFVFFQLFNEINCKSITGSFKERFSFSGCRDFNVVWLSTLLAQVVIVQYAGDLFNCIPLSRHDWMICVGVGFLSIPFQIIVVDPLTKYYVSVYGDDDDDNKSGKMVGGIHHSISYDEEQHLMKENHPRYDGIPSEKEMSAKRRWALLRNTVLFAGAANQNLQTRRMRRGSTSHRPIFSRIVRGTGSSNRSVSSLPESDISTLLFGASSSPRN